MKKIALILMMISILALVSLGACGGNGGDEETSQSTAATTTEKTTTQETSNGGGGGGLTWNDMPIYGGADQIQKGSWSIPAEEGDYSKVEWRYYETGDDVGDIVDFYKDKMPDNGWSEMMWMDVEDVAYGMYTKNNEEDAAMIWMMAEEGDTVIALMRATE
jgi:hypothetical protein